MNLGLFDHAEIGRILRLLQNGVHGMRHEFLKDFRGGMFLFLLMLLWLLLLMVIENLSLIVEDRQRQDENVVVVVR